MPANYGTPDYPINSKTGLIDINNLHPLTRAALLQNPEALLDHSGTSSKLTSDNGLRVKAKQLNTARLELEQVTEERAKYHGSPLGLLSPIDLDGLKSPAFDFLEALKQLSTPDSAPDLHISDESRTLLRNMQSLSPILGHKLLNSIPITTNTEKVRRFCEANNNAPSIEAAIFKFAKDLESKLDKQILHLNDLAWSVQFFSKHPHAKETIGDLIPRKGDTPYLDPQVLASNGIDLTFRPAQNLRKSFKKVDAIEAYRDKLQAYKQKVAQIALKASLLNSAKTKANKKALNVPASIALLKAEARREAAQSILEAQS